MPIVPANIPRPQQNRTEAQVRSLGRSSQPAALKKGGKKNRSAKTDQAKSDGLDRVAREDVNLLVQEVGEEPERRRGRGYAGYEELEPASGHATGMLRREGRAFRRDDDGRQIPPHFADVEQGNLQDAWLLATLAAVAHAQPAALMKRVKPAKHGAFVIRLAHKEFTVSPEFPTEGYAEPEPRNYRDTLWVALYEKAFALDMACSYANLEVGNPARALEMLVEGRAVRRRLRAGAPAEREVQELMAHRRAERPLVLLTRTGQTRAPLVAEHAYAIVDADAGGHVTVYNPWGTRRGSRDLDSVMHRLPWGEIRDAVEFLFVGGAR